MSSHSERRRRPTATAAIFVSYILLMLIHLVLFILLMCVLAGPLVRSQARSIDMADDGGFVAADGAANVPEVLNAV
jgi:hypothetical protein